MEIESELENIKWDIVGVSDIGRKEWHLFFHLIIYIYIKSRYSYKETHVSITADFFVQSFEMFFVNRIEANINRWQFLF